MCRWKSGARGCRRGSRASRQLRSAPLCLCNGKNPLGTRRKISTYAPPAQKSWARMGTRARDGAVWGAPPEPQSCSGSAPRGAGEALPCGTPSPASLGLLPTLPSAGCLVPAARRGKLGLLRGNVRTWQGRISSDGGSGRAAVIYGAWHSHGYIHTHTLMSHPQVSQLFYPMTFGLGILFWCLGSPARMAEPTIAAVCSTTHPKKLLTSSIIPLAPKQILPSSSAPSRAKPFRPSLHKTSFHILISSLCLSLVTFSPCSHGGAAGAAGAAPTLTPGCWSQLTLSCMCRHFPFCLPCFLGFKLFLPH